MNCDSELQSKNMQLETDIEKLFSLVTDADLNLFRCHRTQYETYQENKASGDGP